VKQKLDAYRTSSNRVAVVNFHNFNMVLLCFTYLYGYWCLEKIFKMTEEECVIR